MTGDRLKRVRFYWILAGVVFTVFVLASPGAAMDDAQFKQCMAEELLQADDHLTVGDLKKICRDKLAASADSDLPKLSPPEVESGEAGPESLMARRRRLEAEAEDNPFAITPHKTNYVLIASYNATPNEEPLGSAKASGARHHGDFDDDEAAVRGLLAFMLGRARVTAKVSFVASGSSRSDRRQALPTA